MKGNIGWSAWKQRYCKQCYQNKERRNNPSTLFLLEIIDFFLLPKKTGVQAKQQDKSFRRRDIMRQCQFCKLYNVTIFKRWV